MENEKKRRKRPFWWRLYKKLPFGVGEFSALLVASIYFSVIFAVMLAANPA